MGVDQCNDWSKRIKYGNELLKVIWSVPQCLFLCQIYICLLKSSVRAWLLKYLRTLCPLYSLRAGVRRLTKEKEKFVTCPEMAVIKGRLQQQFPGALECLLKVFSSDERSLQTQLGRQKCWLTWEQDWREESSFVAEGENWGMLLQQKMESGFKPSVNYRDSFYQAVVFCGKTEQLEDWKTGEQLGVIACPKYYHSNETAAWQERWVAHSLVICVRSQELFCRDTNCDDAALDPTARSFSPWETFFPSHDVDRLESNPGVKSSPGRMHL